MTKRSRPFLILTTLLGSCLPMHAVQIRTYIPARHDRFTGFPTTPEINGSAFFDGTKFRAVGWQENDTRWQFALVTRSHLLFATHAAPPVGTDVSFLNASDQIVTRKIAEESVVQNSDGSGSELILLRLDSPVDVSDEISPIPYLNLPFSSRYLGKAVTVFGKTVRVGSGVYENFAQISGSGLNTTSAIYFDYDSDGGGNDDARLEVGDSGAPQFAEVDGLTGLVAINSGIATQGNIQSNFGAFVPNYAAELNTMLSPLGYRMTPTHGGTTSISGSTTISTPTPRQGNPLSVTLTLQNTGINITGNLEAEFHFAAGEAPDSITGTNWVDYGGGDDPTLRRGVMSRFSNTTLTLNWNAAPLVESLDWSVDWRSDKAPDNSLSESVPLGPSFNAWAAGLTLNGEGDDPDGDHFLNLSEYAHGSDPEAWRNLLPNGESARPTLMGSGNIAVLSFPERDDAAARGLSYIPEWSSDLDPASWSSTPPTGLVSSSSPYDPAVPGFVKRSLTWPMDELWQFARVGISLAE